MDIETLVVGELQENCYVCTIGNNTFIVDPGDEVEKIIDACKKKEKCKRNTCYSLSF